MGKNYCSWILVFIGIFLVISGVILGNSLVMKAYEVNGNSSMDKVVIAIKDKELSSTNAAFTLDDIKKLNKILQDTEITFTAHSKTSLLKNNEYKNINIIGTNSMYINFNKLDFGSGCFFTKKAELHNQQVVIIDEALAWEVFGSLEVLGKDLNIFDRDFKIIGVTAAKHPIVDILYRPEKPYVYMPINSLTKIDKEAKIKALQIRVRASPTVANSPDNILNALKAIGKSPDNYSIYDYRIKRALIKQKHLIIIFIAGLCCIFLIAKYIIKKVKTIYTFIMTECEEKYLLNIFKDNLNKILIEIFKIILAVLCQFVLWNIIKFDFYIPPKYIPKELTDISFFWNLFKDNILSSLTNNEYMSLTEIKLKNILMLLNWQFYISIFIGFPLIYIALYQLKLQKINVNKSVSVISTMFIVSIFISIFIAYLTGLPIWLNSRGLIVLYIACICSLYSWILAK